MIYPIASYCKGFYSPIYWIMVVWGLLWDWRQWRGNASFLRRAQGLHHFFQSEAGLREDDSNPNELIQRTSNQNLLWNTCSLVDYWRRFLEETEHNEQSGPCTLLWLQSARGCGRWCASRFQQTFECISLSSWGHTWPINVFNLWDELQSAESLSSAKLGLIAQIRHLSSRSAAKQEKHQNWFHWTRSRRSVAKEIRKHAARRWNRCCAEWMPSFPWNLLWDSQNHRKSRLRFQSCKRWWILWQRYLLCESVLQKCAVQSKQFVSEMYHLSSGCLGSSTLCRSLQDSLDTTSRRCRLSDSKAWRDERSSWRLSDSYGVCDLSPMASLSWVYCTLRLTNKKRPGWRKKSSFTWIRRSEGRRLEGFLGETKTGWCFQIFFVFTSTWGNDPIRLIFFKWAETTNQKKPEKVGPGVLERIADEPMR